LRERAVSAKGRAALYFLGNGNIVRRRLETAGSLALPRLGLAALAPAAGVFGSFVAQLIVSDLIDENKKGALTPPQDERASPLAAPQRDIQSRIYPIMLVRHALWGLYVTGIPKIPCDRHKF